MRAIHLARCSRVLGASAVLIGSVAWAAEKGGVTNEPTRLEPVTVIEKRPSFHDVILESDRVGPANQPEWTARRVFSETDIYVIPPGEIEFNQFYITSHPRHGKPENIFESELEIGLPWRTQFDMELNYRVEEGRLNYDSTRIELPHALANWGKIPFNPAIAPGWRFHNGEQDSFFVRLLLAEEFNKRWHFGGNFGFEQQVGGEREREYEWSAALSYVAIERKLALGMEFLAEYETDREDEDETSILIGPSCLFRPTRDTYLSVVALAGLTHESPAVEIFFIFGFDIEPFNWGWFGAQSRRDELQPVRRPR